MNLRRLLCLFRGHLLYASDLSGIGTGSSNPGDTEVTFRCYRGRHWIHLFFHAHDHVRRKGGWQETPLCACGDEWSGTEEEYFKTYGYRTPADWMEGR